MRRIRPRLRLLLASAPALLLLASHDANAQSAGTTNAPLPNVMLLIDTSGSMERMPDNSLPSEDRVPGSSPAAKITAAPFNHCTPGQESNPNRWGMLVQALTGNMQPFFSCAEMSRAPSTAFANEFKINDVPPYDLNYVLPYHRPLTGSGVQACAFAPWDLPGAPMGSGVGPQKRGLTGSDARDFPPTAFTSVNWAYLENQYKFNNPLSGNLCAFEQANDGQLDATRDYVRFSLMTFDTDTDAGQGVNTSTPPSGNVNTASPFLGLWTYRAANPPVPGIGLPAGCTTPALPFDVGARHWAAPPWEGRHVPFPDPQGNLYDVQRTNEEIQKVIISTRPFGATPIDGLVEDARDYLWRSAYGPNGTQAAFEDPYVKNGCRDSYIILLTDGAPNLNLRPSCGAGAGSGGGVCPYPNEAWETVQQLYNGAGGPKVTTFVIGFSVNGSGAFPGDGFPGTYSAAPQNNCKSWYAGAAPDGGGGTPQGMELACAAAKAAGKAPPGSTADACCQLNKIAFYGSGAGPGAVGAFFAETQADLVLSFGRILAKVSKAATSRTPPAYSPVVSIAGQGVSAKYVTSFIPNARKPWSGEIDRTRASCSTTPPGSDLPQNADTSGDSYAQNTAAQAAAGTRFFISVKGDTTSGTAIDSGRTMRPYTGATSYTDGIPNYGGAEVGALDMGIATTVGGWTEAMDIDANTCKRSRAISPSNPQQTVNVPRLSANDCRDVIWNFTTASKQSALKTGPEGSYEFNVRCRGTSGLSTGTCSVTATQSCTVGVANSCPTGEVCVPECAALGAVYHSTPAVVGPPSSFLREDAFRQFAEGRALRRPTMYVATTDGVLHGFKALETQGGAQGGNGKSENWEMWAFVPPAVLPKLATNYPSGQQILLDGSPVVKDVVWDRSSIGNADQWHTTLVAGMGSGASGYYALNVSDSDCGGSCNTPGAWQAAGSLSDASIGGLNVAKRGPHFLWQLTDIPKQGTDNGIVVRSAKGTPPQEMVALFGRQSGTPAITTVQANPDGTVPRQIGVAILPGGIDGPPVKNQFCPRGIASGYSATDFDRSDPARPPRTQVRRWANGCSGSAGRVAGRSVTIVRLDTGEIIRHFGRLSVTPEVPAAIVNVTNDTPFDSPIVGTPAVYPAAVGQNAQRVFVGDADGTIWSIDLSSTDPSKWKATIFQDLFSGQGWQDSQPVSVPLVVSQDAGGAIVVNAATGDQENITASAITNYVYSIRENPSFTLAVPSRSEVRWYRALPNGERVTGPMLVFDRILYFATHLPDAVNAVCGAQAKSRLWGLDYLTPDTGGISSGGLPRWCPRVSVDPVSGLCGTGGYTAFEDIAEAANSIIPGVTLRPSLVCTQFGSVPEDPTGGITGITPQRYELFFSFSKPQVGGTNTPQAQRLGVTVPVPRISAMIDAWSLVFD